MVKVNDLAFYLLRDFWAVRYREYTQCYHGLDNAFVERVFLKFPYLLNEKWNRGLDLRNNPLDLIVILANKCINTLVVEENSLKAFSYRDQYTMFLIQFA